MFHDENKNSISLRLLFFRNVTHPHTLTLIPTHTHTHTHIPQVIALLPSGMLSDLFQFSVSLRFLEFLNESFSAGHLKSIQQNLQILLQVVD